MLLGAGVKKILVCAPSNAAIDEIVSRVSSRGFVGDADPHDLDSFMADGVTPDGMMVRIGAMEYEASEEVKKHTLDERLQEVLNGNKKFELNEKIAYATELLEELKDVEVDQVKGVGYLTAANNKHCQYMLKLYSN